MIVGIVLSAGRSSRLGSPKALTELDGESFVERTIAALRDGGCDEVLVVVGPPHATVIEAALPGVAVAHNPNPERGMLSSLQAGLGQVLSKPGVEAVLFALVDHPRVRAQTVQGLVARWQASPGYALRPVFEGRGGHPVLLSASAARALLAAPVSASIRELIADGLADLPVDDPGVVDDVDAPEDLAAL